MQIGFLGLLTLVFVVCKLAGVIAWSWFWVLSPAIFGLALAALIMGLALWASIKFGD